MSETGYFLAGGVAGALSRTATAPLDRIKVYLIAQTGKTIVDGALKGQPIMAATQAARPLKDAIKTLWRGGGMRSFFAGMRIVQDMRITADPPREWLERDQGVARIRNQVWLLRGMLPCCPLL